NTSSDWPAVVLSIWNSHVNTNGWADIGYNYLIDPLGRLYEGRGGGDNVTGAHFCGTNGGTMGTCMLGTYTTTSISDTARRMLTRILAWKACGSNINPTGSSWHTSSARNLNHVSGHRDGCATECPGDMTYAELPALRTAVANHIAACNTRRTPSATADRQPPTSTSQAPKACATMCIRWMEGCYTLPKPDKCRAGPHSPSRVWRGHTEGRSSSSSDWTTRASRTVWYWIDGIWNKRPLTDG
ncbi:MAG: hypothetical protein EBZ67_12980, partial [Chitinophagia bacterium]|nr:hypothetical protein [Chitinophagia bacterium]